MSVVPDKITPEIGWRLWSFDKGRLYGYGDTCWPVGQAARAVCHGGSFTGGDLGVWEISAHPDLGAYTTESYEREMAYVAEQQKTVVQQHGGFYPMLYYPGPSKPAPPKTLPHRGEWVWQSKPTRHGPAPEERCSCGLYAVRTTNLALGRSSGDVLGAVSLWGKIVPGQDGWRAEFGYPAEIFAEPLRKRRGLRFRPCDPRRDSLEQYGVPVHAVSNLCEVMG